jgi:hypothetical protein
MSTPKGIDYETGKHRTPLSQETIDEGYIACMGCVNALDATDQHCHRCNVERGLARGAEVRKVLPRRSRYRRPTKKKKLAGALRRASRRSNKKKSKRHSNKSKRRNSRR